MPRRGFARDLDLQQGHKRGSCFFGRADGGFKLKAQHAEAGADVQAPGINAHGEGVFGVGIELALAGVGKRSLVLIRELAESAFVLAQRVGQADEIAIDDFVEALHALDVELGPSGVRGLQVICEPAVGGFVGVWIDLGAGCEDLQALRILKRIVGCVEHHVLRAKSFDSDRECGFARERVEHELARLGDVAGRVAKGEDAFMEGSQAAEEVHGGV